MIFDLLLAPLLYTTNVILCLTFLIHLLLLDYIYLDVILSCFCAPLLEPHVTLPLVIDLHDEYLGFQALLVGVLIKLALNHFPTILPLF